jgi:hypothetical protein
MTVMNDSERRAYRRHAVDVDVLVETASSRLACQLKDVGHGGALLEVNFDVPVGSRIAVVLPNVGVKALAGVRRVAQQGLGIEFDDQTIGAIVTGWARGFAV